MTTTINQQVKENERLDKETSRNLLLSIKSQDNAVNIFEYQGYYDNYQYHQHC